MPWRRLLLILLFAARAVAQEEFPTSTAIVPVVGSVIGATMVHWRTDVEIINDTGAPVDVAIEIPNAAEQPVIFLSLAPGEIQRFSDITAQAFGLEAMLSPLRVTTSGRRSVSVRAAVYAERDGERFPIQPLTTYFGSQDAPMRVLEGLAFSEEYRTNLGFVNFGEADADFVVALQRVPGRNVAVSHVRVRAGGMVHQSIQSLFPLITSGTGFGVVIESPARGTYVYASVIESAHHAGRFITARPGVR